MVNFTAFYASVVISIAVTAIIYTIIELIEGFLAEEQVERRISDSQIELKPDIPVEVKPPPPPPPIPAAMKFDTKLVIKKASKPVDRPEAKPMDSLMSELKKRKKTVALFE